MNDNKLDTVHIVLGALLATSEALSLIPSIESKGIFQLVYNILKSLVG